MHMLLLSVANRGNFISTVSAVHICTGWVKEDVQAGEEVWKNKQDES